MALYDTRLTMICAIVLVGLLTWGIVAYQCNENACAHALVVKQCEHAHHSVWYVEKISKPRKCLSHLTRPYVVCLFGKSVRWRAQ